MVTVLIIIAIVLVDIANILNKSESDVPPIGFYIVVLLMSFTLDLILYIRLFNYLE